MSRMGTTIGGWLTIRYRPSTCSASFESACRLSRVRALSAVFLAALWTVLACFLSAPFSELAAALMASSTSWAETRAYQMSIVRISANRAIASRYAVADASEAARASASVKPLFRAAIVKLAAMRLTSYSNGPGSVSSKSLRSNSSTRSGDAKPPKFDRWASPQSWTSSPAVGVSFRSAAMILAAPR